MGDRCHWEVDSGTRFHVPGCWGTVHDPDGVCICEGGELTIEDRLIAIETVLASLARPTHEGGEP